MVKPEAVKKPKHELYGNRECVKALFKRSHPPRQHGVNGMFFAHFRIFRSTAKEADRRQKFYLVLTARKENGSGGHTIEYDTFESDRVL